MTDLKCLSFSLPGSEEDENGSWLVTDRDKDVCDELKLYSF